MRALTLWRPWHFAILHLKQDPKRVENRPWKPWESVIGTRIALHAGRHWDDGAPPVACTDDPRSRDEGVVGTAIVRGWIRVEPLLGIGVSHSPTLTLLEAQRHASSHWYFGPFGWVLEDVRALSIPIACSGALGLWRLPAAIESELVLGGFA